MTAWQARAQLERGDLDEAALLSDAVLDNAGLAPITGIAATCVRAVVATRRGHEAGAGLDAVLATARGTGEAQRLVPVAVARAEAAWLSGRAADIVAEIDVAWPAALVEGNRWHLGELSWWLTVAGEPRPTEAPPASRSH